MFLDVLRKRLKTAQKQFCGDPDPKLTPNMVLIVYITLNLPIDVVLETWLHNVIGWQLLPLVTKSFYFVLVSTVIFAQGAAVATALLLIIWKKRHKSLNKKSYVYKIWYQLLEV